MQTNRTKPAKSADQKAASARKSEIAHLDIAPMFVPFAGLAALGIVYSWETIKRLMNLGRFPKPVYISRQRPAWRVTDLQRWGESLEQQMPGEGNPHPWAKGVTRRATKAAKNANSKKKAA